MIAAGCFLRVLAIALRVASRTESLRSGRSARRYAQCGGRSSEAAAARSLSTSGDNAGHRRAGATRKDPLSSRERFQNGPPREHSKQRRAMPKDTFRVVTRGADGKLRIRDYDHAETLVRMHTQIGVD